MYKPDPRLPPEQQMLPTHAKRLQQEQRAREAKEAALDSQQPTPATLTPERPLGITRTPSPLATNNSSQSSPQNYTQQIPQDQDFRNSNSTLDRANANSPSGQWPLKVAPPVKPASVKTNNNSGNSPISPDQPHGGYSTIPKVQNTPLIGSAPSPKPMPQPMLREKPREKEKEKGCGCCIVM